MGQDHPDVGEDKPAVARVAHDAVRAGGYELVVPADAKVEREEAAERVEAVHAQQSAEDGQREAYSSQGSEREMHAVLCGRDVQQRKYFMGKGVRRVVVCQDDCTLRQAKRTVDELYCPGLVMEDLSVSALVTDPLQSIFVAPKGRLVFLAFLYVLVGRRRGSGRCRGLIRHIRVYDHEGYFYQRHCKGLGVFAEALWVAPCSYKICQSVNSDRLSA